MGTNVMPQILKFIFLIHIKIPEDKVLRCHSSSLVIIQLYSSYFSALLFLINVLLNVLYSQVWPWASNDCKISSHDFWISSRNRKDKKKSTHLLPNQLTLKEFARSLHSFSLLIFYHLAISWKTGHRAILITIWCYVCERWDNGYWISSQQFPMCQNLHTWS